MYDILYPSPRLVNMAQNKQKEVEILSLQEFENFIGNLRKIMSGGSRYNQHVFEHNIAEVIKNGMEVIQQIKSKIGLVRHTFCSVVAIKFCAMCNLVNLIGTSLACSHHFQLRNSVIIK